MERKTLLSVEQFQQLARPTSAHLEEEDVLAYIRECEDEYIIPAIGYGNFKAALGLSDWDDTIKESFDSDLFTNGGEWSAEVVNENGNKHNKQYYCCGLRKALSYFAYAKILRADGTILSRAGTMRHRDDYSDHIDEPKLKQYNDVMGMAERYISDCLSYLKANVKSKMIAPVRGTRARIHAIGD